MLINSDEKVIYWLGGAAAAAAAMSSIIHTLLPGIWKSCLIQEKIHINRNRSVAIACSFLMAENTYDSLIFIDLFILFIHVAEVMNSKGKNLKQHGIWNKIIPFLSYHMNSSCCCPDRAPTKQHRTSPTIIFLPTPPCGPENLQYFGLEQCRKTGRRQQ